MFGVAAITQILAGLGIAPFVNMLVWFWGVMVLGGIGNFVGGAMKTIGYDTGYKYNDVVLNSVGLKNLAAMPLIRNLMVQDAAMQASVALSLYMQMENWHWAAWEKLPQEDKETQLEELMAEIEEWDAEQMAEMEGEMKEEKSEDAEEDASDKDAEDAEDADEDADEADEEVADEDAEAEFEE